MTKETINLEELRSLVGQALWANIPLRRLQFVINLIQTEGLLPVKNATSLERAALLNQHCHTYSKLPRLIQQHSLTPAELEVIFCYGFGHNAFWMHYVLFLTTFKLFASDVQLAQWLQPAERLEFLSSFCQTELAHGSDVQSLQMLATYDKHQKAFDLHTPSPQAVKWWPGALGYFATHGIRGHFVEIRFHIGTEFLLKQATKVAGEMLRI